MKQIHPDVWETDTETPAPGLTTHAYLVIRPDGNLLIYNTGHKHEIDNMARLGGVSYQFLSHRDELGKTLQDIRSTYGAKLGGHQREEEDFAKILRPDIFFNRRTMLLDNVEVIPTPVIALAAPASSFIIHWANTTFSPETPSISPKSGNWRAGVIPGYTTDEARC